MKKQATVEENWKKHTQGLMERKTKKLQNLEEQLSQVQDKRVQLSYLEEELRTRIKRLQEERRKEPPSEQERIIQSGKDKINPRPSGTTTECFQPSNYWKQPGITPDCSLCPMTRKYSCAAPVRQD